MVELVNILWIFGTGFKKILYAKCNSNSSRISLDYAPNDTSHKGWTLIEKELKELDNPSFEQEVRDRIEKIKQGERDLYF